MYCVFIICSRLERFVSEFARLTSGWLEPAAGFADVGDAFRAGSLLPTGGILVGISFPLCLGAGLANGAGAGLLLAACCWLLHFVDVSQYLRSEIGPTPLDWQSAPYSRASSR